MNAPNLHHPNRYLVTCHGVALTRFNYPEYHGTALHGQDFLLPMRRLDAGTARVHSDIHTAHLVADVSRLERLGAKRVQRVYS